MLTVCSTSDRSPVARWRQWEILCRPDSFQRGLRSHGGCRWRRPSSPAHASVCLGRRYSVEVTPWRSRLLVNLSAPDIKPSFNWRTWFSNLEFNQWNKSVNVGWSLDGSLKGFSGWLSMGNICWLQRWGGEKRKKRAISEDLWSIIFDLHKIRGRVTE